MSASFRVKNKRVALSICGFFELCFLALVARALTTGRVVAEFGHDLSVGSPSRWNDGHATVLSALATPIRYWGSLALFVAGALVVGYFFVALLLSPSASVERR